MYFLEDELDLFLLRSISRYSRSLAFRVAKLSEPPLFEDLSWLDEECSMDFPAPISCFLDLSLPVATNVSELDLTRPLVLPVTKVSKLELRGCEGSPVGVDRFSRRDDVLLNIGTGVEAARGVDEEDGIVVDTDFLIACLSEELAGVLMMACCWPDNC